MFNAPKADCGCVIVYGEGTHSGKTRVLHPCPAHSPAPLVEALAECVAFIEAQAAIKGRSLTPGEWLSERERMKKIPSIKIGVFSGPSMEVNLVAARAALEAARKEVKA